ncbi:DUF1338 family protein [Novosphingobium sp. ST904]|uniref:2-oxoadipate dioxygenase/decarboxylase family protein n=1 Tax=Novosphingobium sp. ST904 TaxID=1684385 RepID=UPI0006C8D956|nr:DUF1338 family protein [Novosphingobium sp. ST904]KPH60849.1 IQ calmodulin-binding motif-containing protein [Novosphingobium sp. ST904]TCM38423.1 uncharacterized protein DUF1338 [Novosphingobium sp. ST904]
MPSASSLFANRDQMLYRLLSAVVGEQPATLALTTLAIDPALAGTGDSASRAQVAMALNAALFVDLLDRVPTADRYVQSIRDAGEAIVFDHGALRTIDGETGELPRGHEAFARFLAPLGYEVGGLYPLPALKMTGRAYVQRDLPETIPQFFVSELHVSELPEAAQTACANVFGTSADPLGTAEWQALGALSEHGEASFDEAVTALKGALAAFGRQHEPPALADYEVLLPATKEGAWIATEGNAFNHATTRVANVIALAEELREDGYPMKPSVEISRNGRVRQTAILADKVVRPFREADGAEVPLPVPGSFYEFITRDIDPETGKLDLTFDSGNATGIFAVTRNA